jgi:hypothetical protein
MIPGLLDDATNVVLRGRYPLCLQGGFEIGQSPGRSIEAAIQRRGVQKSENRIAQFFARLQMKASDSVWPSASGIETSGTIGAKPREPLENRLDANPKILGH